MDQSQKHIPAGVEIRYTEAGDAKYLKEWLSEPETGCWFPMEDEMEIDDAVLRWIAFHRYKCSLTITKDGIPCGLATLYLQPYRNLSHQCEFGILLGKAYRNMGIGGYLIKSLMTLAKEKFKIELLHLQVNAENPAIDFYKHYGFKEFGRQNSWIKIRKENRYGGRVFMERFL
jgi:putative acetyltransferase